MFQVSLLSRNSCDCTSFKSRFEFGMSDQFGMSDLGGVDVILFCSVMFFKSKLVGFSIMIFERRSK